MIFYGQLHYEIGAEITILWHPMMPFDMEYVLLYIIE